MFADELGYALIGEKPISHDYVQDSYLRIHPHVCERFITSLKEMFKDSNKYILKVFEFTYPDNRKSYEIELIHKPALKKLISKNALVRKFIRNNFTRTDVFYKKIENPNSSIFQILRNEYIAGIFFGYGEENARHYCRKCELGHYLKKRPYVLLYGLYISRFNLLIRPDFPGKIFYPYEEWEPDVSPGFNSLEEEWEYIKSVNVDIASSSDAKPPYFINFPIYIACKGPQSEAVHTRFLRAREKLARMFNGKSYQQAVEDQVRQK